MSDDQIKDIGPNAGLGAQTSTRPTMAAPTMEGFVDAIEALHAACDAGKWTLLAPDGRVWMNTDPMILLAALAVWQVRARRRPRADDPGVA